MVKQPVKIISAKYRYTVTAWLTRWINKLNLEENGIHNLHFLREFFLFKCKSLVTICSRNLIINWLCEGDGEVISYHTYYFKQCGIFTPFSLKSKMKNSNLLSSHVESYTWYFPINFAVLRTQTICSTNTGMVIAIRCIMPGIILCMRPANERWRYTVTPSLIGWVHTQNDPCMLIRCGSKWPNPMNLTNEPYTINTI